MPAKKRMMHQTLRKSLFFTFDYCTPMFDRKNHPFNESLVGLFVWLATVFFNSLVDRSIVGDWGLGSKSTKLFQKPFTLIWLKISHWQIFVVDAPQYAKYSVNLIIYFSVVMERIHLAFWLIWVKWILLVQNMQGNSTYSTKYFTYTHSLINDQANL